MITTPNMGLVRWDQPNDLFSFIDLHGNFNLLDLHDHSSGKGVQIPTAGLANLSVTNPKIAANAVDASKIIDGAVTDTELASPANNVWRTIYRHGGAFGAGVAIGSYYATTTGAYAAPGTAAATAANALHWTAADYSVAGKTTKLRMVGVFITNTVSPAATLTLDIREITGVGGAAANISYTLGASVAGSALAQALTGSNRIRAATAEFTPPADGIYVATASNNAITAANSFSILTYALQMRHV